MALQPGESRPVSFTLDKRSFAVWNEEIHDWYVETGDFTIEIGGSSRDLPLKAIVRVESTTELPRHYTMDSIFMDIMADPKAREIVGSFMKQAMGDFGHAEESGGSDAAKEAVTEEMTMAMMQYMPLRGILSFGGPESSGEMEKLLEQLNQ